jgi:hypothetical protein
MADPIQVPPGELVKIPQPGMMASALGANWRTTFWGTIAAVGTGVVGLCVSINQAATATGTNDIDPTVQFILYAVPAKWRFWLTFSAAIIAGIAGQRFAHHSKSKNVMGGTIEQDAGGNIAVPQIAVAPEPHAALPLRPIPPGTGGKT